MVTLHPFYNLYPTSFCNVLFIYFLRVAVETCKFARPLIQFVYIDGRLAAETPADISAARNIIRKSDLDMVSWRLAQGLSAI